MLPELQRNHLWKTSSTSQVIVVAVVVVAPFSVDAGVCPATPPKVNTPACATDCGVLTYVDLIVGYGWVAKSSDSQGQVIITGVTTTKTCPGYGYRITVGISVPISFTAATE